MRLMRTTITLPPKQMTINNLGFRAISMEEQHLRGQMRELRSQIESCEKFMALERKRLMGRKELQEQNGLQFGEIPVTEELIRIRLDELRVYLNGLQSKYADYNYALQRAAEAAQAQSSLNL